MSDRSLVMYLGGFARVGGIESFARDFLVALRDSHPSRELVMWGRHDEDDRLLNQIADSGVRISRSPWRWGCARNLPDFLLVPAGLRAIHRAAAVIFKRPPPRPILGFLRRVSGLFGRRVPFIIIMPYRPLEYWGVSPHPAVYEHFDIVVVQSDQGIEDLRRMGYRGRIENIPYLPPRVSEPTDFPMKDGQGTVRLGFLGRLAGQKNLGYLLEIYHFLTSRIDPTTRYELHLFGDGHQRAELEQKTAALQLPRVTFHGEVPREQVAAAIDSCDLFLNTSSSEGQCLVALEVLSRGRPMVATPVGALPEVLGGVGVGRIAPLGQPDVFAAAVSECVAEMRSHGITPTSISADFCSRYNYETIVERYQALIDDAISGPAREPFSGTETASSPLTVSIMVTTKNRVDDLRRTCRALKKLSPPPLEILITADGCTDDTVSFLQAEMASARIFINEVGCGSIASRDRMIRAAQGDLVLSLDDDSYPQEIDCLSTIAALFAQRPSIAVLHFPQCTDEYPETLPTFDFGSARATRSYSSSGAVLRRETYLRLPGFEPTFFHAYEEPDYALQCVAAGCEIWYDPSVSIRHHYTSVARNECRTHQRHARNEFWSTLLRCPFPQILLVAPYRALSQLRYAFSRGLGWVVREPAWWLQALRGIPRQLARRQPVSWANYRRWLALTDVVYPPVAPRETSIETRTTANPRTA